MILEQVQKAFMAIGMLGMLGVMVVSIIIPFALSIGMWVIILLVVAKILAQRGKDND